MQNPSNEHLEITEEFNNFLINLNKLIENGILWNPTLSDYIKYQQQLNNVKIIESESQITLSHNNKNNLDGLTIALNYTKNIETIVIIKFYTVIPINYWFYMILCQITKYQLSFYRRVGCSQSKLIYY